VLIERQNSRNYSHTDFKQFISCNSGMLEIGKAVMLSINMFRYNLDDIIALPSDLK
jgi:hypothetical protein